MNTTVDFSFLLPTRGRPDRIQNLFNSIVETARHPENIEIILYVDEDDTQSHSVTHPVLKLVTHIGPRVPMGKMIQTCYAKSRGEYIMLLGDDNVFRTQNWDERVIEAFNRFPDKIALVFGNDLNQEDRMCTAPFISRVYCELTDGPCHELYPSEFIDTHIMDMFYKLRYWGLNRIVYMADMVVEHMHYIVGKAPFDDTYREKPNTDKSREVFFSLDPFRVEKAKKTVNYIKQFQKV